MPQIKSYVDDMIKTKRVVIFSKSGCSDCTKAKKALNSFALKPDSMVIVELDVDKKEECQSIQDYLKELTGARFFHSSCLTILNNIY